MVVAEEQAWSTFVDLLAELDAESDDGPTRPIGGIVDVIEGDLDVGQRPRPAGLVDSDRGKQR